eukprot:COSAG02_NODE_22002_length_767_cov_1.010479_2_plen_26_part_01
MVLAVLYWNSLPFQIKILSRANFAKQ